jgi:type IV pilus assembly protein PilY1
MNIAPRLGTWKDLLLPHRARASGSVATMPMHATGQGTSPSVDAMEAVPATPAHDGIASRLGRVLTSGLCIWLMGLAYVPPVHAAASGSTSTAVTSQPAASSTSAVAIDQQPLTLQPSIPPNIVLMLDDSGSMAWDYMPDASYLAGQVTGVDENGYQDTYVPMDGLRSSSVNGTYYNPKITYNVPVKADGSSYAVPTGLGGAYFDPFSSTSATVDVTMHASTQMCSYNNYSASNCPSSLLYDFPYYTAFPSGTAAYLPTVQQCKYGYTLDPTTGVCYAKSSWNSWRQQYTKVYSAYSCNSGDTYNNSTGWCEPSGTTVSYTYLFTYTTVDGAGNYVRNYVGKSSDCTTAKASSAWKSGASCTDDSDESGVAAPNNVQAGKNIAIWFSYYRKRILMAKSGLMTAFSTLDPKYRVGFGSIDNNGYSAISGLGTSNYKKFNDQYIAYVKPFGDGSSGSQKSNFWNWVTSISPNNGTPLREALDAVGAYYKTSQPWQTMSSDPVADPTTNTPELACRQSYTILTTDGFWNGNYSSKTTSGASDTGGPTNSGSNDQTYTYSAVAPYSGGDTSDSTPSLADVAAYYWKTDLRSTPNEVPPSTDDPAFWQHMATFTMGLGFTPKDSGGNSIDMDSVFSWAQGGTKPSGFAGWPQPASNSINNIADLAHAAVNGHGGFYSATSPDSFTSGLKDALKRATERVGTGASLAANSTQLKTGTMAYQANYYTSKWKGDLKALAVDPNTGAIAATPTWTASNELPAASDRVIKTYNPDASSPKLVDFKNGTDSTTNAATEPALSSAELTALGSTTTDVVNMVNYLRGDSSLEQKNASGIYRNRDTPLGDIVDSQPVYSGAPNPNEFVNQSFTGTDTFSAFAVGSVDTSGNATASKASTRTPLIYVAANDGMLHAFDASTGKETFAYLPAAVILAGVKNLSDPAYGDSTNTQPHQYYNDGELTIADAYFSEGSAAAAWHTVLVGTTGRGIAKSIYALDVTDPANISLLWERYAADGKTGSDYIGQMVGKPVIAQTTDGVWSVLIGNGYNSAQGVAALLQFDLATGSLAVHTTGDATTGNGLAAPVAWMDDANSGVSTEAYAGDRHGYVWSFPLNYVSGSGKNATITACGNLDSKCVGTKIFTATDASGGIQPITAGMLAGKDPKTGNVWLFFGTGQYLSSSDLSNLQVQSWYGVIAQAGSNSGTLPSLPATRSNLVQRSIIAEQAGDATTNPPTLPARAVSSATTNTDGSSDMSGKRGWYLDLESPTGANGAMVAQGERMVTPSQFQGNLLLGTTRIPEVTDVCNPSGRGWVMALDPFTGTNPSSNFFDLNGDGSINNSDRIKLSDGTWVAAAGVGFNSLPNNPIFVGGSMLVSFDNGTTTSLKTSGSTGAMTRVSWQELTSQ